MHCVAVFVFRVEHALSRVHYNDNQAIDGTVCERIFDIVNGHTEVVIELALVIDGARNRGTGRNYTIVRYVFRTQVELRLFYLDCPE